MEASPSDLTKWMAEIIAARATENWLNLPKPTHVHKWEWDHYERQGFRCSAPGCEVYWLNPEDVEALLNEHASTYRVEFEGRPNFSGQAVYSQVTTPWTERQA